MVRWWNIIAEVVAYEETEKHEIGRKPACLNFEKPQGESGAHAGYAEVQQLHGPFDSSANILTHERMPHTVEWHEPRVKGKGVAEGHDAVRALRLGSVVLVRAKTEGVELEAGRPLERLRVVG